MEERLQVTEEQKKILKSFIEQIDVADRVIARKFGSEDGIGIVGWRYINKLRAVKLGLNIAAGEIDPKIELDDFGHLIIQLESDPTVEGTVSILNHGRIFS